MFTWCPPQMDVGIQGELVGVILIQKRPFPAEVRTHPLEVRGVCVQRKVHIYKAFTTPIYTHTH
jgi:hypothetical protein